MCAINGVIITFYVETQQVVENEWFFELSKYLFPSRLFMLHFYVFFFSSFSLLLNAGNIRVRWMFDIIFDSIRMLDKFL